jgi:predicted Zn-dependent protease
LDALQTLANLRVIRAKDEEARSLLKRMVKLMLKNKEEELPTIEFRMVSCRLLVELQEFKDAVRVLDTVVQENDEMPEAWYLLAFAYFNLKKYQNA